jgi:hypothetical protein
MNIHSARLLHYRQFPVLPFILLFIGVSIAAAQTTRTIHLKPIYKNGWSYFYDTKKVHSAYSLEIPLQSIEDELVTKHFQKFKTMQRLRGLAYLPLFIWFFSTYNNGTYYIGNEFYYFYLGGIGLDIGLSIASHGQMRKAIDLYNISILQKSKASLWLERQPQQTMVSLGYLIQF